MKAQTYPEDYSCILATQTSSGGLFIGNLEAAQSTSILSSTPLTTKSTPSRRFWLQLKECRWAIRGTRSLRRCISLLKIMKISTLAFILTKLLTLSITLYKKLTLWSTAWQGCPDQWVWSWPISSSIKRWVTSKPILWWRRRGRSSIQTKASSVSLSNSLNSTIEIKTVPLGCSRIGTLHRKESTSEAATTTQFRSCSSGTVELVYLPPATHTCFSRNTPTLAKIARN